MGERVFSISLPTRVLLRKLLKDELGDVLSNDEGVAEMFFDILGDDR